MSVKMGGDRPRTVHLEAGVVFMGLGGSGSAIIMSLDGRLQGG
jgi:hypothetical protein